MFKFLNKFLNYNQKEINRFSPVIEKINSLEKEFSEITNEGLRSKTDEFKLRLERSETLNDILPETFACVREASKRVNDQRPRDVQILAGAVLHEGKIAEQKTGEGKTLSAAFALYLNALSGRGVHLVTVNDYLARRDAGWMGGIYDLLGLSTSATIAEKSFIYDKNFKDETATDWRLKHLKPVDRKTAYLADITYGINSEFGFDYLRDNMAREVKELVQRDYHYAIVDEVDSILIDEARTPHIISAPQEEATQKYFEYAKLVERLTPVQDYVVDEKLRTANLTEHGLTKVEKVLGVANLYEKDFQTVHHIEAALKAQALFVKEKDYIVRDGEVIIVDEFTGRLMPGRRWSEGIHQAVEAKEGVSIQQESRTLATVSLQNYFRKYEKLAGMTGTAATEAEEFHKIYKLEVVIIPTYKPMIRTDNADVVYKTTRAKYAAVVKEIEEMHRLGRPVLVGTTSIDKNEIISNFLKRKGIPHQVLNAKQHEKEAVIIANAGKKGAVTVATNMAGRGVDIVLGGEQSEDRKQVWQKIHDEVVSFGGLHVIGTERHESRRIDNQLRGRSGRQGDPGSSRFFVALDDEIMKLFGGDQVSKLMTFFKMPEDVPLEHTMVSKAIEQAQSKVEGFHFDSRKHVVEYDDVMNRQREIIYRNRREILVSGVNLQDQIMGKINREIALLVGVESPEGISEEELAKIVLEFSTILPLDEISQKKIKEDLKDKESQAIKETLTKIAREAYEYRERETGEEISREIEKWVSLQVIDNLWMEHLDAIDDLREGIGLRGWGQRDPLVEYKNEAFNMFERLMANIDYEIVHRIYKVQVGVPAQNPRPQIKANVPAASSPLSSGSSNPNLNNLSNSKTSFHKLGRNDPCWCGSGKKYKKCHYSNR